MAWLRKPIRGILMDITGVLYESGERKAIEGSVDALKMYDDLSISQLHADVEAEFAECDLNEPNCVVVGDAANNFSYENMNRAFHVLVDNDDSVLITLGKGKYYKEHDKLTMDVGPFTAALEATDRQAIVIGKPGEEFFRMALEDMKLRPEDVVMIGDDIVCDVGGAQSAGMRGVLVRTGKFRPENENHANIRPDAIVKNLMEAIERILSTERPTKPVLPQ
ncbi:hypothetical protein HPB52_014627 [Rhipicephalus sanguineus]|uniref:Phospholysine phosphohistidine inorganic pyrophosphate phosphatase n=1 Tax=Rhipicephalus sanguineus TaxID=34632 RepID=A0A9D4PDR7_RHISA|nr:hypothetical protein HPB52_014627 [Rhipicephalus sanguineus]